MRQTGTRRRIPALPLTTNPASALLLSALLPLALWLAILPASARVPAGQGGMIWRSATPAPNTLRGVAAALRGADGAGLVAVGDASTLLLRRAPFGAADGWGTARQRGTAPDVSFRGVSMNRPLGLLAVAADDGTVLLGNGLVMPSRPWAPRALNAVGISQAPGLLARVAAVGDAGQAFFADYTGSFVDITVSPAKLDPAAGRPDLFAMRFAPGEKPGPIGYAVGTDDGAGVILKTDDGGASWAPTARPPLADSFFDVFVVDVATVVVLGSRSGAQGLYRSLDGGQTWTVLSDALPPDSRTVAVLGTDRYVVAGPTGLFVSSNGGQSFEPANTTLPRGRTIGFEALDAVPLSAEAFAVGEAGIILWTRDAGASWEPFAERPITVGDLSDFRAAEYLSYPSGPYLPAPNGAHLLVASADGSLLESRDGGDTFGVVPSPVGVALRTIAAPSSRNVGPGGANPAPGAFIGGDRRTVVVFDAAQDKAFLRATVPEVDYLGVAVAPNGAAWAVGRGGVIVRSDGGPLWTPQPSGTAADLHGVTRTESGVLYAVGDGGTVLRSSTGSSWAPVLSPNAGTNLLGVGFYDAAQGYVVGTGGVVAATSTAGTSWELRAPAGTGVTLHAVSVVPGTNGQMAWAVGSNQTLLRTADGGKTWNATLPRPDPLSNVTLRAVQFLSPSVGYVAGDDGRLFRTTSGGLQSWEEIGLTLGDTINGLRFSDPLTGVVVGSNLFTGAAAYGISGDSVSSPPFPSAAGTSLNAVALWDGGAVAVGSNGGIWKTTNFLTEAWSDEASSVAAMVSYRGGVYVAVGDVNLMMFSEDGGATWLRSTIAGPVPTGLQLTSVGFSDGGTGIPVGYSGGYVEGGNRPSLYRSTDGGANWAPAPLDLGEANGGIGALGVVNASNVLAAAGHGWLYRFNGQTWRAERPVPAFDGQWTGLLALDARQYVVGERGAAARYPTRLGKEEWEPLNPGTRNDLAGIAGPPLPGATLAYAGGDSLHDDICNAYGDWGAWLESTTGGVSEFGDTNADAEVTLVDATTVLQVAAGLMEPTVAMYFMGDVVTPAPAEGELPGDGYLTILDAAKILRTAMGL